MSEVRKDFEKKEQRHSFRSDGCQVKIKIIKMKIKMAKINLRN